MTNLLLFGLLAASVLAAPSAAPAQAVPMVQPIAGTRIDLSATGTASRVPDLAIISAGVVTKSATATGAIAENAARMERVRSALRRAGIADNDIQTSSINLSPDYRYDNNRPAVLAGYQAANNVAIKFRDIRNSGKILDALVAEGANQISGPSLTIDKPEAAFDEARAKAIAAGRVRAELYARALGMRIVRLISVSESAGFSRPPMLYTRDVMAGSASAKTEIEPGSQNLEVTLAMSFELQ